MPRPLIAILALAALALAGCSSAPPPPPRFPEIVFSGEPIKLAVAAIDIVEAYQPPLAKPHVEHLFPISPEHMAARWPKDRLVPAGGSLRARYTVKEAGVTEIELPRTEGIRGVFTKDQGWRYDAALDVVLDIVDERGFAVGTVTAHAERSQTVAEDVTLAQRDEAWYAMTQAMAKDLNAELERNIRANLARFIVY
jgi:hypothetical protein